MEDHTAALREHGYHELLVKDVVAETHDASSFVLEVPAHLAETFRYRPGQFCTFRVHVDGLEQLRSYSMSSAPQTDDDLTVTVKRVAGGAGLELVPGSRPSRERAGGHQARRRVLPAGGGDDRCSGSVAAAG